MNPVVLVHFFSAFVVIVAALPLTLGLVRMNRWYGVRIPAAFESEKAWFAINRYGGRLFLFWGLVIAATALIGASLERKDWSTYNWMALAIILGGLASSLMMLRLRVRRMGGH